MKGALVVIVVALLLVIAGMYTGYIQIGPAEDGTVVTDESPDTESDLVTLPGELPDGAPEPADEAEVTEEDGGVTVKTPSKVLGAPDVSLSVDKDNNWSMDIYEFVDNVDLSGFSTDPEDETTCEEDCDDYCSDEVAACQDICGNVFANLCANALTALTVCETSCAAVPPPFNELCSEGCDAAYNDACTEESFEECKDDCQGIHYNLCTDECYDEC